MLCNQCDKEFSQNERNIYLPEFSSYIESNLCINCLIDSLKSKQTNLYPDIQKAARKHKKIKQLYFDSSDKVSELTGKYRKLDYEKSIILFNINQEKIRKEKKATKPAKKKSDEKITAETIQNMLANLTAEERKNVLSSYHDMLNN